MFKLTLFCLTDRFRHLDIPLRSPCIDYCRANPGCLDDLRSFKVAFVKKVEKGQKQDATKRELADARKG